jgi:hypothetical protein
VFYPVLELFFSTTRLSETTYACRKQQSLVGNDKALLETTSACWKQQSLVGNDKALSETTKLSKEKPP